MILKILAIILGVAAFASLALLIAACFFVRHGGEINIKYEDDE